MYEHDDDGRLVRALTRREVEWDDTQQAHMLALGLHRDLTCGGCGGYMPDTTATAAEEDYRVPPPVRCHRCTALSIAADTYRDNPQAHALRFRAERH